MLSLIHGIEESKAKVEAPGFDNAQLVTVKPNEQPVVVIPVEAIRVVAWERGYWCCGQQKWKKKRTLGQRWSSIFES